MCSTSKSTLSSVPSGFVSVQFCAQKSTKKRCFCVFFAQKGPPKTPQKHRGKNATSRHIRSSYPLDFNWSRCICAQSNGVRCHGRLF
jgi:hypothetical protein